MSRNRPSSRSRQSKSRPAATRPRLWLRVLAILAVIGIAVTVLIMRPVRLGLDLEGGTQIVLQAKPGDGVTVDADSVGRALEVLRRRVDQIGVSEPSLQRAGNNRIIIELPGVDDADEAAALVGQTAQLTFHPVLGVGEPEELPDETDDGPGGANGNGQNGNNQGGNNNQGGGNNQGNNQGNGNNQGGNNQGDTLTLVDEDGVSIELGPEAMTGSEVRRATADLATDFGTQWLVNVEFTDDGDAAWAKLTGDAACNPAGDPKRRIAIVLDDEVISSPQVAEDIACDVGITGGQTSITGNFDEDSAKDLALLIRAGALPVPVEIVEQRVVGPTLGEQAIRASIIAAAIGALLTMIYMIAYYRLLGLLASIALVLYGLLSFAALVAIGATLTLPGIAGFVLAIGMAVDANVLIFERIKEEDAKGATLGPATSRGFTRAWTAIADSNVTTVLAALILFFLATGAVKGFGITLAIGVLVSMFTAVVVTRVMVEGIIRSNWVREHPNFLGLRFGASLRDWLAERGPNLMAHMRAYFVVSLIAIIICGAGIFIRGVNLGLDFSGGRLLEMSTEQPVDLDELRDELAQHGFANAVIQFSGEGNVSIRTEQISDEEEADIVSSVEELGGQTTIERDEFVGASIGSEMIRLAIIALALALFVQVIYLAIRFRWTYGTAAMISLFHDVIIVVGIFAWYGKTIDAVFLAAILTVIGYSVNDSVVIFDRVRELRAERKGDPLRQIANDACLQTVPRTINTGLGALFVLAVLFVLGGDTLADFAFTLLVGILVGTYSSVFVAIPTFVELEEKFPESSKTKVASSEIRASGSRSRGSRGSSRPRTRSGQGGSRGSRGTKKGTRR